MRINCEILDLQAFLAVLDVGNFHRAADLLNMSQPALSRRVKALELALGATLLERSTRRVTPTRIGRELEPMLRRLLCEFENCVFSLGDMGARHPGHLTIASVPTAASFFLPDVIKRFSALYPDIRFRILDMTAKDGLDSVFRGEAEFRVNFLGASRPELKFTPIIDDEFVLACRKDHEFASKSAISWRELIGRPLIVSQKNGNRSVIDQALAKSDLHLNWFIEVGHLATSFGLMESGVGMCIIPRLARPVDDHPLIAVVPLRDPVVKRTIGIVEKRGGQLSRAAMKFRELLLEGCDARSQKISRAEPALAAMDV